MEKWPSMALVLFHSDHCSNSVNGECATENQPITLNDIAPSDAIPLFIPREQVQLDPRDDLDHKR